MRLYLSRMRSGRYLLTALRPQLHTVRGTGEKDWYPRPGEPIDVRDLCPGGVRSLWGVELEPLGQVRVELSGKVI